MSAKLTPLHLQREAVVYVRQSTPGQLVDHTESKRRQYALVESARACQRRIQLDDVWFRLDLVFFHRHLRCLVIIDLKVGRFGYADAGQMHLYLNYARKH